MRNRSGTALALLIALVLGAAIALATSRHAAAAEGASWSESGMASHYGPGGGVAMHFCTWAVRHAEGCGYVTITALDTGLSVVAPVVDWCECVVPGSAHPVRVVDLQYGVVAALGLDPAVGLYPVTVEAWAIAVPDTATPRPIDALIATLVALVVGVLAGFGFGAWRTWRRRSRPYRDSLRALRLTLDLLRDRPDEAERLAAQVEGILANSFDPEQPYAKQVAVVEACSAALERLIVTEGMKGE